MVSTIGIVSLSSGVIGRDLSSTKSIWVFNVSKFSDSILSFCPIHFKGLDFIKDHPKHVQRDLMQAFSDDSIDMILCAIGGDDTYRLLPYLLKTTSSKGYPTKDFSWPLGYNHEPPYVAQTRDQDFYGQSFLADICRIGQGDVAL